MVVVVVVVAVDLQLSPRATHRHPRVGMVREAAVQLDLEALAPVVVVLVLLARTNSTRQRHTQPRKLPTIINNSGNNNSNSNSNSSMGTSSKRTSSPMPPLHPAQPQHRGRRGVVCVWAPPQRPLMSGSAAESDLVGLEATGHMMWIKHLSARRCWCSSVLFVGLWWWCAQHPCSVSRGGGGGVHGVRVPKRRVRAWAGTCTTITALRCDTRS